MSSPAPRPVVIARPSDRNERPLIVEIPHAGIALPDETRPECALDEDDLRRDADLYVDRLYAGAEHLGAVLLYTEVSRFVVDLNRAEGDVDARSVEVLPPSTPPTADAPRGLLWRITTDGKQALTAPLSPAAYERRLARWFRPYHEALDVEVARLHARFGRVVVLSGHSMPSVGKATHADPGKRRADVVPGDLRGAACAHVVMERAAAHFAAAGYSVAPNDPYLGGNTTRRHGRPPEGVHALQVELNRDVYMDEASFAIKEAGFAKLREQCLGLVELLSTIALP